MTFSYKGKAVYKYMAEYRMMNPDLYPERVDNR